jgi:hypothetical protein
LLHDLVAGAADAKGKRNSNMEKYLEGMIARLPKNIKVCRAYWFLVILLLYTNYSGPTLRLPATQNCGCASCTSCRKFGAFVQGRHHRGCEVRKWIS